jgi:2,4-dienoyl-CoA reductase-like NADH-dependent reductase (Old Yellow Enzyme family)
VPQPFQRIGHLHTVESFLDYLRHLGFTLPCDQQVLSAAEGSPLAQPMTIGRFVVGNRWCIHPMEGWDGTSEGAPSERTIRRWQNFGASGAKLIWGGEAVAVRREGRANPNQLCYQPENAPAFCGLREALLSAHRASFGAHATDDLLVGLQLTHSGRFCRPNEKARLEPRIAYHHPVLDRKFHIRADDDSVVIQDEEIPGLIDDYVAAARMAQQAGFAFVDVKHCHGYLGHEFLSAYSRPGPYGGSFENRTRFLRETIAAIRAECPGLMIGVRLSAFDLLAFCPDPTQATAGKLGPGVPEQYAIPYPGFGCNPHKPLEMDLTEPVALLRMLRDDYQVELVNLSAGSPYYNPHIQRPAFYPPSDGYQPPEDPLVGCARQIRAVAQIKREVPGLPVVGTAYSYLQEYLPHVAQAVVREGWTDFVGIGRLVLSYWQLPADVLAGRPLQTKRLCRTFSDCTSGPRMGLPSGCYPLDPFYKDSPEADELKRGKDELRKRLA